MTIFCVLQHLLAQHKLVFLLTLFAASANEGECKNARTNWNLTHEPNY